MKVGFDGGITLEFHGASWSLKEVDVDEDIRQKIEEILGQMKCPKRFKCAENGLDQLCQARDVGLDKYLECLEDNPTQCKFAFFSSTDITAIVLSESSSRRKSF